MEMPSVVHPRKIDVFGFIFEVVSYVPLTDEQALKVALMYYRSHKLKKKDRGTKLFTAVTLIDEESAKYL